jgi:mono/diheme cytochrome c family protein
LFWVEPFRLPPRGRNLAKKSDVGRIQMQRSAAIRSAVLPGLLLLGVLVAGGASAQQAGADEHLTATQKLGRQVFAQSCGICHLPPQINARTYGPLLSKDTAGGSDEVIRGLISEGTPRMPAFKHYLARAEIDAIIAYLKTVPATATR